MRLLLDESVPKRLRNHLPTHDVRTVVEMGWSGVKNGTLLALAKPHFDAFITVDKNLPYQQNLTALPVAVVVLRSFSNDLPNLLPLIPKLEIALTSLVAGSCVNVDMPSDLPSMRGRWPDLDTEIKRE